MRTVGETSMTKTFALNVPPPLTLDVVVAHTYTHKQANRSLSTDCLSPRGRYICFITPTHPPVAINHCQSIDAPPFRATHGSLIELVITLCA